MRQRVLTTVAAMVVAMPAVLTVGVGEAAAEGATFMSFAQTLRRCDFSENMYTGPSGYGRPTALVRNTGSELIADVQIATALPNMPYDVRLIQMPRSSASSCNAGDPGVIAGVLMTDAAGAGSVSLRGPVASGATGAWMYITRPGEFSQTPAEYYTSDFVMPLKAR
jgi:hypothetical protein